MQQRRGGLKTMIYTFLRGQTKTEPVAETWHEVIDLGWTFIGLTKKRGKLSQRVLMTRNGYINEFFEVEND